MPKLMRGLVLGAMLAVMGSATAAVAQTPPDGRNEAVQQFRAGERTSQTQPVGGDDAVQRFRAGERASHGQPVAAQADRFSPAQPGYREYYQANRPEPGLPQVEGPDRSTEPSGESDRTAVVLSILVVVAALVLGLDAMAVRRKARKEANSAI